jgi:hypothetical protein
VSRLLGLAQADHRGPPSGSRQAQWKVIIGLLFWISFASGMGMRLGSSLEDGGENHPGGTLVPTVCRRPAAFTRGHARVGARERWPLTRYVNVLTPLRWQCAEGHIWKASPGQYRGKYADRDSWCPVCRRARYTIDDMRLLAAARGGECLSSVYVDRKTHLRWRCARGHVWEAQPAAIRRRGNHPGTWCPICEDESLKLTLDQMRELARLRGGECLSTSYLNARAPLEWRCSSGHIFLRFHPI